MAVDYDAEAHKLWYRLGLEPGGVGGRYNAMDKIFRHPSGGTLYVGGERAANNLQLLQSDGVSHVVNCTDSMANFHEGMGGMTYLRFNVSYWSRNCGPNDSDTVKLLSPLLEFVCQALQSGKSVLVHCLAGAHRAGTTGVILLMYLAGLRNDAAIATAQQLRPVINPIGSFPQLLDRVDRLPRNADGHFQMHV